MNCELKRQMEENLDREIAIKADIRLYEHRLKTSNNELEQYYTRERIKELEHDLEIVRDRGKVFVEIEESIAEEYFWRYA